MSLCIQNPVAADTDDDDVDDEGASSFHATAMYVYKDTL